MVIACILGWPIQPAEKKSKMMKTYHFDDRNIHWNKLGYFKHFVYTMLDVDVSLQVVDFLIKFDPLQKIFLHRHLALTNTFVIQGEHRLYETNGVLKEIRPVGSYSASPPGNVHREGGGNEETVVFYSVRGKDGILFEVLDDNLDVVATLSMVDFIGLFKAQQENSENNS